MLVTAQSPAFLRIHRLETAARLLRKTLSAKLNSTDGFSRGLSSEQRDETLTDLANIALSSVDTDQPDKASVSELAASHKLDGTPVHELSTSHKLDDGAEAVLVVQVLSHREEFLGRQVELMWRILVPEIRKLKQVPAAKLNGSKVWIRNSSVDSIDCI